MKVNGLRFQVLTFKFRGVLYVLGLKITFLVMGVNSIKFGLS